MKESRNVMVVDFFGGPYALQLDTALQPYGYRVESCHQPSRIHQRLSREVRYELVMVPLSLATPQCEELRHVSAVQLAYEVVRRLRQEENTALMPVLLLLMQPEKSLLPYITVLEEVMKLGHVDLMPMPCETRLLAIKCNHFIRLSKSAEGLSAMELPRDLNSAMGRVGGLSRREVEILHLVGEGLSNKEISQALTLSEHSVRTHIYHIFAKLGIKRRSQAVLVDIYHKFKAASH